MVLSGAFLQALEFYDYDQTVSSESPVGSQVNKRWTLLEDRETLLAAIGKHHCAEDQHEEFSKTHIPGSYAQTLIMQV